MEFNEDTPVTIKELKAYLLGDHKKGMQRCNTPAETIVRYNASVEDFFYSFETYKQLENKS